MRPEESNLPANRHVLPLEDSTGDSTVQAETGRNGTFSSRVWPEQRLLTG